LWLVYVIPIRNSLYSCFNAAKPSDDTEETQEYQMKVTQ